MSSETISIPEALQLAIQKHREGQLLEAENIYLKILEVAPDEANSLHFLGVVSHQLGRHEQAIARIERSLRIDPEQAGAHNNLGNIYRHVGRQTDAETAYRNALKIDPDLADAHHNLGNLLRQRGEAESALEHFRRAVAVDPSASKCRIDLVDTLTGLRKAERLDEAAAVVRTWIEHDPLHPGAQHLLAALTGENVPERASDEHVRQMFDNFADGFDEKLATLDYRAPELLRDAISDCVVRCDNRSLDLGCGTGWCGVWLKPLSAHLVGIDLSPNMIKKARSRNLYDELVVAELSQWMTRQLESFDLIIASDTINYFGELSSVIAAVANCLRLDGVFAFTIESLADADSQQSFRLEPHGRYSHCADRVAKTLESHGMVVLKSHQAALRKELGEPVIGEVIVARKTSRSG